MESAIARIVDIEKKYAKEIAKAEEEYTENIGARKLQLEANRRKELDALMCEEQRRLSHAIEQKKKYTEREAEKMAARIDVLLKNNALQKDIRETIVAMVLSL